MKLRASNAGVSPTYRVIIGLATPIVCRWGRLAVIGLEHVSAAGPLILAGNHDSHWDPIVVGVAARPRRQICALAKASMWKYFGVRHVLNGMRQIPIERAGGDDVALQAAVDRLRTGACIGMFPEGTLSFGKPLRARSGVGRIAKAVPETRVVAFAVEGAVDLARFPKRPHVKVTFFAPDGGGLRADEDPAAFSRRLMHEVRVVAPPVCAGRKPAIPA